MGVGAGLHLQVQRELRGVGERPEELLRQLVLEATGRTGWELRVKPGVWTTGDIDGAARARLVHRHHRGSVAGDSRAIPERLVEPLAEDDCGVLDGVVRPRLQVAADRHVEVEVTVSREQVEHVIEETDTRLTSARPGAVKGEPQT